MRIYFRVDAGPKVGLGHLTRSLLIANTIRQKNRDVEIIFLTSDDDYTNTKISLTDYKHLKNLDCTEEEFLLKHCKERDDAVLFIDKLYNYSENYIQRLTTQIKVIMFHNMCDGGHLSDAFILPAAHVNPQIIDNFKLLNSRVKFYQGMDYVVLNKKITDLNKSKTKTGIINLVITTGGSDPSGVMLKVLDWINQINLKNLKVYALIGETFVHFDKLQRLKKELNSKIKIVTYNVNYFSNADIVISTFGVSTYEMIYLGFVILSIGHCEQNARGSKFLSQKCNQLIDLGNIEKLSLEDFKLGFNKGISILSSKEIKYCSLDGNGVNRVIDIIYNQGK